MLMALTGKANAGTFDYRSAIKSCAPPSHWPVLERLVMVESSGRPYAININGSGSVTQPRTHSEATRLVRELFEQGKSFDIGLGQINAQHFRPGRVFYERGLRPEDALDPCINLKMASFILSDAYRRTNGDILATLSVYNTGQPERGLLNGYVDKFLD
jgi:type IV secretion system protein VirB1